MPVGLSTGRWLAVWSACLAAFLVLVLVPLVLTLAHIRTKNLWVPVGAHVLFDTAALFLVPALT